MHPKALQFVKGGLFENIDGFPELERRIASFKTANERGSAFEVLAQAYLATQTIVGAAKVWHLSEVPAPIARKLRLDADSDMGVDGVVETNLGTHSAYQVKFRSGRPALSWNELSTFMGLTDQADHRILFTNCEHLPPVINERSAFHCVRGSDLDRLEPLDFEAIHAWLKGSPGKPKKKKTPLLHQREALDAILPSLAEHDRVTTVMASATGKTLVSLWVAERAKSQLVLVLVPSLALLRQILHVWTAETSWPRIAFLCVCSDPTVQKGLDDWIVRQADVDFPVTTDPSTVRSFLSRGFDGTKLVLSTYQSAHVVAEGMDPGLRFDLAVFDEAHRTAGREGRQLRRLQMTTGAVTSHRFGRRTQLLRHGCLFRRGDSGVASFPRTKHGSWNVLV